MFFDRIHPSSTDRFYQTATHTIFHIVSSCDIHLKLISQSWTLLRTAWTKRFSSKIKTNASALLYFSRWQASQWLVLAQHFIMCKTAQVIIWTKVPQKIPSNSKYVSDQWIHVQLWITRLNYGTCTFNMKNSSPFFLPPEKKKTTCQKLQVFLF